MSLLIGLSSLTSETQTRLNTAYVSAFTRKGVTPVILPSFSLDNRENLTAEDMYAAFAEAFDSLVEKLDGLVLTGGVDINPDNYNALNYSSVNCDTNRDFVEMVLFNKFRAAKKPIMGICRGHQLIGNLMGIANFQQNLDASELGEIHVGADLDLKNRQETAHRVQVYDDFKAYWEKNTKTPNLSHLKVNSWHHQGFTLTPDGEAPELKKNMNFFDWRSAMIKLYEQENEVKILGCSRLVIEALKYNQQKIFSVQWHPEEYGPNSITIGYWIDKFFGEV